MIRKAFDNPLPAKYEEIEITFTNSGRALKIGDRVRVLSAYHRDNVLHLCIKNGEGKNRIINSYCYEWKLIDRKDESTIIKERLLEIEAKLNIIIEFINKLKN